MHRGIVSIMTIMRIEKIIYGVDDLPTCTRFYEDVGLESVCAGADEALFRTPANQFVVLRKADDPRLPPPCGEAQGIREVVWGVESESGLSSIRSELAKDRDVDVDADGTLHSRDVTGYPIGFALAKATSVAEPRRSANSPGKIERYSEGVKPYGRARPTRLIHVAMDIPAAGHEAANDFYTGRLGFKPIDRPLPMGTFMQCEGDLEHHNLLLCHRTDRISTNHLALEVRDFDEVIEGGNYLTERGWKESRRLGRHTLGSNVFRMFHAPCGGRIEYAHDMDRMSKEFQTRVWEKTPPHHLWMLKFPGDADR
jgi:catechol 2,3-dioxygenase-like lactoylglutathione lyase family enzyme